MNRSESIGIGFGAQGATARLGLSSGPRRAVCQRRGESLTAHEGDPMPGSGQGSRSVHRRRGRSLALEIGVVTYHTGLAEPIEEGDLVATPPAGLSHVIERFAEVPANVLRALNAAVQRVSTLRPPNKTGKCRPHGLARSDP